MIKSVINYPQRGQCVLFKLLEQDLLKYNKYELLLILEIFLASYIEYFNCSCYYHQDLDDSYEEKPTEYKQTLKALGFNNDKFMSLYTSALIPTAFYLHKVIFNRITDKNCYQPCNPCKQSFKQELSNVLQILESFNLDPVVYIDAYHDKSPTDKLDLVTIIEQHALNLYATLYDIAYCCYYCNSDDQIVEQLRFIINYLSEAIIYLELNFKEFITEGKVNCDFKRTTLFQCEHEHQLALIKILDDERNLRNKRNKSLSDIQVRNIFEQLIDCHADKTQSTMQTFYDYFIDKKHLVGNDKEVFASTFTKCLSCLE